MSSTVENTPEPEGESTWLTARQELATRLPLTGAAVHQSFYDVNELATLIIDSQKPETPLSRKAKKRGAGSPLNFDNKRRGIKTLSTPRVESVGPIAVGDLQVTFYSRIDPDHEVENQATIFQSDIVLKAPASTIEAIKEAATKREWHLTYRLSASFWKADKVFVKCCIQVPARFVGEFPKIIDLVNLFESSALGRATKQSEPIHLGTVATEEENDLNES